MFDMFDDLMIDDDYGTCFESYMNDDEFLEAMEEQTIAIESLAYDIAMEAEKPKKEPGKMAMLIAKMAKNLRDKCQAHEKKAREKKHEKRANIWKNIAMWFDKVYRKFAGVKAYGMHTDEIDAMLKVMDEKKNQVLMLEQKEANDIKGIEDKSSGGQAKIEGRGTSGRIGMAQDTVKSAGGKHKKKTGNPVNTPNVIAVGGSVADTKSEDDDKSSASAQMQNTSSSSSSNVKTMSKPDRLKANYLLTMAKKYGKKNDMTNYNKFYDKFKKVLSKYDMSPNDFKGGNESFINYDPALDMAIESILGTEAYAETLHDDEVYVVVEGLLSKPKTQEQMLARMQKKVNRLKTVGACDDMLRQVDAEAQKFNSAISALKNASADFSQTNDKRALRKSAGPVLKELNKTCKILKIKSIASDPKNITEEEIKKLHDFISGAKQLITARKKVLSGGASEGFIYGYDDDFDYDVESYDDDDFFGMIQDYGYGNIADEAMFDEFDNYIAIATEGIINPDTKRAYRIKYGEKKRAIKSILKKAKAARKAKDYETAITMYKEAKKGYQGLMADAKKLGNYVAYDDRKYNTSAKRKLINWCLSRISDCDDAIEAIQNARMKSERKSSEREAKEARKAAKRGGASESYLYDAMEYEAVFESLFDDEDDYDDDFYDDDDYDEYDCGLESLLA